MEIRLLRRDEIEEARWNGCVHYAHNSKIYGYTWYLDNVSEEWVGLVEGNYQSVMPLVFNDKLFGLKQLLQPFLCQQLGIFSVNVLSKNRIEGFLNQIPSDYKYWNINFNDGHKLLKKVENIKVTEKANYILELQKPYELLKEAYSTNTKRNIKKAEKANLYLTTDMKVERFVEEVKKAQRLKGIKHPDALYHAAHRIIYNCMHRGLGAIVSAYTYDKQPCAAIFFMTEGRSLVNLLNYSSEEGRAIGAMPFLLDKSVQRHANSPKYIDFEGSSVPGIARFYESFGAKNVPYYQIEKNDLPWWIKWYK